MTLPFDRGLDMMIDQGDTDAKDGLGGTDDETDISGNCDGLGTDVMNSICVLGFLWRYCVLVF
jgi:hypothetical protein